MFNPNQRFLVLDFETFSECDIKKSGGFEYSTHPSTEILCAAWAVGTREELKEIEETGEGVSTWSPSAEWSNHRDDTENGTELWDIINDPSIIILAHNSMFEQAIIRNVMGRMLRNKKLHVVSSKRFFCTAVQCSVHALPRSLDGACQALGLRHQKDKEGHRLMLKISKPRKPTKNNTDTRHTDPDEFDRLVEYCKKDIFAEIGVFLTLPPLIPQERDLWVYDQQINFRGARVDRSLVKTIQKMIAEEKKRMTMELRELTDNEVQTGGQGAAIQRWLRTQDVHLDDLKAKTVEDALKNEFIPENVKKVLKLRQGLNKTSLKKYSAFLTHTGSDGRMRFSLNFHATVHGRWGGAGVQPHNFPRGTLKHKDEDGKESDLAPLAAELIKGGADLEMVRLLFEEPIEVFVSCLRTMIIPSEGKELFVSDFAAIEARVLFWLANHQEGCKAFVQKRKMYEELAMVIFNRKRIEDVLKDERFVGKQAFLGSGYGMGWKKFMKTCQDFGQDVSVEVAKKAITGYRELHAPVPALWANLEKAAIAAVKNPKKTYKINNTEWFMKGKFLYCRLPSGRCLHYYGPQVKYEKTPWGETKALLYHWTVDSKTKKWTFIKTWGGVLTQNCVGGISRDLLAASMVRQEKAGYEILLTVHDENVAERKIGEGSIEEFNKLMQMTPKWGNGIPMAVEGFCGTRYRK